MTTPMPANVLVGRSLRQGADCAYALHDALLEAGLPKLAEYFTANSNRVRWALGFSSHGEVTPRMRSFAPRSICEVAGCHKRLSVGR